MGQFFYNSEDVTWAQGIECSRTMFHHTANIEWAQEASSYSDMVFHHTAHIVGAQDADYT